MDRGIVVLDGNTLTPEALFSLRDPNRKIKLCPEAVKRVVHARKVIDDVVESGKVAYGVNTGFGMLSGTIISPDKLEELQINLIRSHAAGFGEPLPFATTRMVMALRLNILAKGHSGISLETLEQVVSMFNANCVSCVPTKGTVGCSGDLAPLSHLALGCMGEGMMWDTPTSSRPAAEVLAFRNLEPIRLKAKEGLALINGTQLVTAVGVEALMRSRWLARQADVVAALTVEALKGTVSAFDEDIHRVRPHPGQVSVAARLRALLHGEGHKSEVAESHKNCDCVQDAYSLRCIPQVHGQALDTLNFVYKVLEREMNSATDNPMVFPDRPEGNRLLSGGNFHGEYPAKMCDFLAISMHELANISERRIERLVNPALSGDLHKFPFLSPDSGLNSGFMIAHCTAAALVSENKVLTHPSSVDSISTSGAKEDHVSMGGFAARKALQVVNHVEAVVAIEMLAACQGLDLNGLASTPALEAVRKKVRERVPMWSKDRFMAPDIEAAVSLLQDNAVWDVVYPFVKAELALPNSDIILAGDGTQVLTQAQ